MVVYHKTIFNNLNKKIAGLLVILLRVISNRIVTNLIFGVHSSRAWFIYSAERKNWKIILTFPERWYQKTTPQSLDRTAIVFITGILFDRSTKFRYFFIWKFYSTPNITKRGTKKKDVSKRRALKKTILMVSGGGHKIHNLAELKRNISKL